MNIYSGKPYINSGFFELSNVVLSPYIVSGTAEIKRDMSIMAAEIIIAGLKSEVPSAIWSILMYLKQKITVKKLRESEFSQRKTVGCFRTCGNIV